MSSKKQLYLYPFTHSNGFIERTKHVFSRLGYTIHPFKRLYKPTNLLCREDNWVVLNWYEDQPFRQGLSGFRRLAFIASFFISLWLIRLFSKNIIWVRHNYRPHNEEADIDLYRSIVRLMRSVSDKVVTLERTELLGTSVTKHPLYKEDAVIIDLQREMQIRTRQIDYLYFGSIKPYKRLDALLAVWPESKKLTIRGYCSDNAYTRTLEDIIERRGINVDWENRFLSDEELEAAVADSKYVILPHDDHAMISSGTFYMAVSLGANILCFDSAFARNKAERFDFVQVINPKTLPVQLEALRYMPSDQVMTEALAHYSDKAVTEAWRHVLSVRMVKT